MVVPVRYTMAKNLCEGKQIWQLDMTSLSALLNTTTPDTIEFNNIHSYEEITFCNLAALTEKHM